MDGNGHGAGKPGPVKGRGAATARTGRFEPISREGVDDGWPGAGDETPALRTTVGADAARHVLSRNTSPDVPFDRSVNPYRGCEHGCVYCYARPTHAYLGLSPGLDFETKLFAKHDAAALLAKELSRPGYAPAPIALGANTDPYQPVEKRLEITRAVLGVLRDFRHPAMITTKGALVTRDIDILGEMAALGLAQVAVSVTTLDRRLANRLEPRAATPGRRLQAIETLAKAGIPTSVMVAPVIPALTDAELETILAQAARAGASGAGYTVLRLPHEIKELMAEWLDAHAPGRKDHVLGLVRAMRAGRLNDPRFRSRMKGEGPVADMIAQRFALATRRLGLGAPRAGLRDDLFRVPGRGRQLDLL